MDIPTQLKILFLTTLANWISKEKSHMIEYLLVANRILKSKLESDGRRIKYSDSERAILAKKGRKLNRQKNMCAKLYARWLHQI